MLALVNTINDMIGQLAIFAVEVKKVAKEVGTEGKLGVQADVGDMQGIWQEITYVYFILHFSAFADLCVCSKPCCECDGQQLDDTGSWIRPDLSCSHGRRLLALHHCRS